MSDEQTFYTVGDIIEINQQIFVVLDVIDEVYSEYCLGQLENGQITKVVEEAILDCKLLGTCSVYEIKKFEISDIQLHSQD